ncbi:hypothetical protein DFP72DRAFT_1079946 [Ephemerocybe angulata]|uniref:MYND-type domain-containing protein n=1 Tax=Ephemerocybe angulata TaxID=980116 RepID=A0A8H6LUV0_9AGAR|nr:hypothetical protein DFP72DRAFT_1079946 [Tulosesus angulatus]
MAQALPSLFSSDPEDFVQSFLQGRDKSELLAKVEEGKNRAGIYKPISLETALDIMVSTMENPMGPETCSLKFNIAVGRFRRSIPEGGATKARRSLEAYPDVMRAIISFFTRKQSSADHAAMLDHLATCCCPRGDLEVYGSMHSTTPCVEKRIFLAEKGVFLDSTIGYLSDCLVAILSNMTQGKFRQLKNHAGATRRQQPWPHGIDDLLPNGLADSVDGFNLWVADKNSGHFILRLVGTIAQLYPIFGLEIVSRGPDYVLGLQRPVQHLVNAMDAYDRRPEWWIPKKTDARFAIPVSYALNFIHQLYTGGSSQYTKMMVTGGKKILLPVLLRGIAVLSPPYMSFLFRDEFFHMNFLMSVINNRPNDGAFCMETLTDLEKQWFRELRNAHQGGCYNPTCVPKSNVVHAPKCSSCDLIRYCDAKCQKEAWKNQQLPHRAICPKIKSLRERLGPYIWARTVSPSPEFTYRDFMNACKKKKIDMELVKEVGLHISCLQGSQTLFRNQVSS